jgi:hypothetical protein
LVEFREGVRVTGLRRNGAGWQVITEDDAVADADLVIDASGRGSRISHWLTDLGVPVPEPERVDAQFGYACRLYRAVGEPPLTTGVAIANTPLSGRSALALPVENDHWLVIAGGYGMHRPTRDPDEFVAYLANLRDSAIADTAAALEPVSDIAVYRQTSNQRRHYGKIKNWPDGLLVVGDSACAFNPLYGQGMTVAAQQAMLLRDRRGTPGLQGRLDRVADFCWSLATTEDLRHPTSPGELTRVQRLVAGWTAELARLAERGIGRPYRTFVGVYHLMIEPRALFHPALFAEVAWARVRGRSQPAPRPAVLDRLRPAQHA